jgi:hypothetical protein
LSSSSGQNGTLTVVAVIVLIVVFRIFRNLQGIRVSAGRTIFYIIFYFAFGGFFVALSFFEGVSPYYLAPDVVAAVLAGIWSYRFADRRITFWTGSDGSVWYKGGIIIYLIYVAALIARIAVDFLVIGPSSFQFSFAPIALSQSALIGETVTDLLLAFGIGLLIGRNVRVFQRYQLIISGKEKAPPMP